MFKQRVIYGIHEVAEELGISREATSKRKQRGRLPDPDEVLAAGPVWLSASLREFFKKEEK